jgi:hypothetical protein
MADGPLFTSPRLDQEGKPCFVKSSKLKILTFNGRVLQKTTKVSNNQATLTLDYEIEGTPGGVNWTINTCFRPNGKFGPIPNSEGSKSVTFNNSTPQLIGLTFAFLSCECRSAENPDLDDKIWKRIEKRMPASIIGDRKNSTWTWRGFDKNKDDLRNSPPPKQPDKEISIG